MNITNTKMYYEFSKEKRGWKGDVPVVRFDTNKFRKLGWKNKKTSKEALRSAIKAILEDVSAGRLQ